MTGKEISPSGRPISAVRTGDRFSNTPLKRIIQTAFLGCVGVVLVACGGGGGGSGGTGATPATGAAVSQGTITAKGSVFVNGIEYSTTGATIRIDDNPGIESDLKVGMVVRVRGTSDDSTKKGTATLLEARDILEGTISNVNAGAGTITVMGQTVRIEDNMTRLNDDDLQKVFGNANFQVNDHVEVHGFADDQGGLRATRVLRKATGEFESKGFVTGLGATSFGLSPTPGGAAALTVNFTAGSLPAGTVNGSFVEVKSAAAAVGGAVTATLVHLEDRIGAAGEKVEVEGIVSSGTLASFVVNGQQVVTSPSTLYEGGLSSDFAIGVKLEAEGPLDANGAIAATKISFRSNIKIEDDASAVTATSLTVLGRSVAINQFTRIDNGPPANTNHVEVRAAPDRDGNLIAQRIVVQGASDNKAFLQGPVTAADGTAGTLTILGTTVVSNGTTEWRVSSTSTEVPVSRAAFFAQIVANASVVKVRWDPFISLAGAIEEAEIETSATTPAPTTSTSTTGATTSTTATGATTSTTATTPTTTTTTASTTTTTLAALNALQ
jgi:hypothetical protein